MKNEIRKLQFGFYNLVFIFPQKSTFSEGWAPHNLIALPDYLCDFRNSKYKYINCMRIELNGLKDLLAIHSSEKGSLYST